MMVPAITTSANRAGLGRMSCTLVIPSRPHTIRERTKKRHTAIFPIKIDSFWGGRGSHRAGIIQTVRHSDQVVETTCETSIPMPINQTAYFVITFVCGRCGHKHNGLGLKPVRIVATLSMLLARCVSGPTPSFI